MVLYSFTVATRPSGSISSMAANSSSVSALYAFPRSMHSPMVTPKPVTVSIVGQSLESLIVNISWSVCWESPATESSRGISSFMKRLPSLFTKMLFALSISQST